MINKKDKMTTRDSLTGEGAYLKGCYVHGEAVRRGAVLQEPHGPGIPELVMGKDGNGKIHADTHFIYPYPRGKVHTQIRVRYPP
jgi:hypothetical protein